MKKHLVWMMLVIASLVPAISAHAADFVVYAEGVIVASPQPKMGSDTIYRPIVRYTLAVKEGPLDKVYTAVGALGQATPIKFSLPAGHAVPRGILTDSMKLNGLTFVGQNDKPKILNADLMHPIGQGDISPVDLHPLHGRM